MKKIDQILDVLNTASSIILMCFLIGLLVTVIRGCAGFEYDYVNVGETYKKTEVEFMQYQPVTHSYLYRKMYRAYSVKDTSVYWQIDKEQFDTLRVGEPLYIRTVK